MTRERLLRLALWCLLTLVCLATTSGTAPLGHGPSTPSVDAGGPVWLGPGTVGSGIVPVGVTLQFRSEGVLSRRLMWDGIAAGGLVTLTGIGVILGTV